MLSHFDVILIILLTDVIVKEEEAKMGFWQKLVSQLKFCSVYEKSTNIYYIKQNEKHLYINILHLLAIFVLSHL